MCKYNTTQEKEISIISKQELISSGCIYFDRIEDGFSNYKYQIEEGTKEALKAGLLKIVENNQYGNSYVDFYYGKLNEEERGKVHSVLKPEQIQFLKNLELGREDIYFKLTPELFEITFTLSVREMLFSTYYFSKKLCTVWSNYNHQMIYFYQPGHNEPING
jgi:hypothetical protein